MSSICNSYEHSVRPSSQPRVCRNRVTVAEGLERETEIESPLKENPGFLAETIRTAFGSQIAPSHFCPTVPLFFFFLIGINRSLISLA